MIRLLIVFSLLLASAALSAYGGDRIRVAVVDTGLDLTDVRFAGKLCDGNLHRDFSGAGLTDTHGHGTHVAGLILQNAGAADFCMVIVKYYLDEATTEQNTKHALSALIYAASLGVEFVNYSGGGEELLEAEYFAIARAPKTTFVCAAGNDGKNVDGLDYRYFPASYRLPNIVSVGNLEQDGKSKNPKSNFGVTVKVWEIGSGVVSYVPAGSLRMTGTSQAAAIHTGKLIAKTCRGESGACELKRNIVVQPLGW